MLTEAQLDQYHVEGCLCIEDFASQDECREMIDRAEVIVEGFDPEHFTVFRSDNDGRQQTQYLDRYFLESSSNVSCFFEAKAFDEDGKLAHPKAKSINKIGHALHELDPVFRKFGTSEKMQLLLKDLGFKQPMPVQSTFIFKQPNIGGEVAVHQDATFLYTDPPTVVGLWLALEDATRDNGCLWTLPGSQNRMTQPTKRFIKDRIGNLGFDDKQPLSFDIDEFVPLEVKAGTMVVIHGLNIHYSADNLSPNSRRAYILHAYEGPESTWDAANWLHRSPSLPLKPIYKMAAWENLG